MNVILGQNLKIAKVKNTVTLQPRQGKWIPLSCNFSHRKDNEFLFPVLFNTIVERNLLASKFSPQAGASRSCAIYIIFPGNAGKPRSRTSGRTGGPRAGTKSVPLMFVR